MDRQGFPVSYVEKLSKKASNISATGINLEFFGLKHPELQFADSEPSM